LKHEYDDDGRGLCFDDAADYNGDKSMMMILMSMMMIMIKCNHLDDVKT
jgi:hypothetical protein